MPAIPTCSHGRPLDGTPCERCEALPPGVLLARRQRRFIVHTARPEDRPQEPLRVPRHYCIDCGQHRVPCFECDVQHYRMTDARDGYHLSICEVHGPLAVICPKRAVATVNAPQLAAPDSPGLLPRFSGTVPAADGPLDDRRHEEMQRCTKVGVVCLLVGFLLGIILTMATVFVTNAATRTSPPVQVE